MGQGSSVRFTSLGAGLRRPAFFRPIVAIVICFASLAALTGCSSFFTAINTSTTPAGSTTFAYVANVGAGGAGGTLTAYSLTSGVLTALSGSPYSLPATPTSVVVAPNNAFLFVGTNLGVFVYTIASDGTLTEGASGNVAYQNQSGLVVQSMVVDSTSSWLIVSYQKSTELDALAIDATTGVPTGTIFTDKDGLTFATAAPQLAISPANNNVFAALGTGGVNVFGFNAASTSSTSGPWGSRVTLPLTPKSTNVADTTVSADSTSTYLFVAEASTLATPVAGTLRQFPIANLNTSAETDYPTGIGPSAILSDLSGSYVYVTNQNDNTISGFSISAGALTALTDSPFQTAKAPVAIAEDSTKSYVLDVGYGNNPNLWIYSFDATTAGTLDVNKTATTGSSDPSLSNAIALTH